MLRRLSTATLALALMLPGAAFAQSGDTPQDDQQAQSPDDKNDKAKGGDQIIQQ